MARRNKLQVVGLINDASFHIAKCCAEDLHLANEKKFDKPDVMGLLEFEWNLYLESKKKELKENMWNFNETAIVFNNNQLLGGSNDLLHWAEESHEYNNFRPADLYETLAEEAYKTYLNSRNHEYVFMDVSIGGKPAGRLLIELFNDLVPKTCTNFRSLATGECGESPATEYKLHYKNSIFHRLVKNGWMQGGDIWLQRGNGGESIYGNTFEDEGFAVKHSRRGIVGMANKGRHANGSQFYITLQPSPWMDTKFVAFGQVIEGTETLRQMEQQNTINERPVQPVTISNCGTCTFDF